MNWGRYAEIFDFDRESHRLDPRRARRRAASANHHSGAVVKRPQRIVFQPLVRIWSVLPRPSAASLPDLIMFSGGLALFYGVVQVGRNWLGPFHPQVEISRSLGALPVYAGYSLLRIALAYVLSLLFAVTYGYIAAYRPRAERFMIPLLDVLQSIPVLSFLPGRDAGHGRAFSGPSIGRRTGRGSAHFYRTSLEHGLQLLCIAEKYSARDA